MTSKECILRMIELTEQKMEALCHLVTILNDNNKRQDIAYKQWYYNRKRKIEQAILKVDIEFLDVYRHLLNRENVNTIGDLSKEKFSLISKLQEAISEIREIENRIIKAEERLLSDATEPEGSFREKHSKHTAPRAIDAYKKFKK